VTERKTSGYGSWLSPLTADIVAKQSIRFGDLLVDGGDVYWVESRPAEMGRSVIVRAGPDGNLHDIINAPYSARSRVHEYGGGAFAVSKGFVYFANYEDQCIYKKDNSGDVRSITTESSDRYGDLIVDEMRNRVVCVQERHNGKEPVNSIVGIDIAGTKDPVILVSGGDFYSSPRLSPDSRRLAWLTWNHPNMPWDGNELWLAEIDEVGAILNPQKVAGGISESICQPEWSPDGLLYFVSDRSGWWNIYRNISGKIEIVTELDAEFGLPQWNFGQSTYGFTSDGRIFCCYNQKGIWHLATIDLKSRQIEQVTTEYTDIAHLKIMDQWAVFYGGSSTQRLSIIKLNVLNRMIDIVRRSEESVVDPGYVSKPDLIEFDTSDHMKAYGFLYRPQNKEYVGPQADRPPLIVVTHGGPTSCSYTSLDLKIQFWTSRGFAILDVNYGGSTGFGRNYRERLNGKWGIVDVDDCINGAMFLVKKGLVDAQRLIIRGGSAGGYTTLAALTFRDLFKAGASYYGVSDLEALAKETHKFESRYLDSLVGPYPDAVSIYKERSPINNAERLSSPVIFFQGLDDKVVPPSQAEKMVKVLRDKGIPVVYFAFEGEQHGFRKAENLKRALEAELYFYSCVFDFE